MLPVTPQPQEVIGRMRFNRRSRNITCLPFVSFSGSPEDRTQHNAVISRVWTTSPRLPYHSSRAPRSRTARGGCRKQSTQLLLPKQACFHLHLCPFVLSVRTAGFEPPAPIGPKAGLVAPGPRPGAIPRLRHVLSQVPRGGVEPGTDRPKAGLVPTGIRSPSACPPDGACSVRTLSTKWA